MRAQVTVGPGSQLLPMHLARNRRYRLCRADYRTTSCNSNPMINQHPPKSIDLSSIDDAPTRSTNSPSDSQSQPFAEDTGAESTLDGNDPSPASSETDTDETDQEGYELPLDLLFELLKNNRRRETLRYLRNNGNETTLSDVAEHIAALENDTTVKAITSSQRKRVYVGLYQCHLPKMDDASVIDFDQNRGTISIGPNAEQLDPYLHEDETLPWHKFYLGIALAGSLLFVGSLVGGAAVGLTPTIVLTVLLASIILCVGAHYRLT